MRERERKKKNKKETPQNSQNIFLLSAHKVDLNE